MCIIILVLFQIQYNVDFIFKTFNTVGTTGKFKREKLQAKIFAKIIN